LPVAWAVHLLGGVFSPANAQYSVSEIVYQLKDSGAKCIFTCQQLLEPTLQAAKKVGIPRNRIYLLDILGEEKDKEFLTVDQLIERGRKLPKAEPLKWSKGEGARRTAFLCYSSGTSGLPVSIPTQRLLNGSHSKTLTNFQSTERCYDFP
jgi:acyl-CoA synthetase (AMP-forming)/AMP-acid ligase II